MFIDKKCNHMLRLDYYLMALSKPPSKKHLLLAQSGLTNKPMSVMSKVLTLSLFQAVR